ncbi:hypothetical protein DL98DRAFT_514729 [Cadophora sp. DSE1049]|nr:hypothetical protein DL98DRAFT_514729 [Cadophora sp. DSE1049]
MLPPFPCLEQCPCEGCFVIPLSPCPDPCHCDDCWIPPGPKLDPAEGDAKERAEKKEEEQKERGDEQHKEEYKEEDIKDVLAAQGLLYMQSRHAQMRIC